MKLAIVAAFAALLATPVLAQSPAVQGRTGSSAGGYLTDPPNPATGGSAVDGPAFTGSVGPLGGRDGITSEPEVIILPPQGSGTTADGVVVPRR